MDIFAELEETFPYYKDKAPVLHAREADMAIAGQAGRRKVKYDPKKDRAMQAWLEKNSTGKHLNVLGNPYKPNGPAGTTASGNASNAGAKPAWMEGGNVDIGEANDRGVWAAQQAAAKKAKDEADAKAAKAKKDADDAAAAKATADRIAKEKIDAANLAAWDLAQAKLRNANQNTPNRGGVVSHDEPMGNPERIDPQGGGSTSTTTAEPQTAEREHNPLPLSPTGKTPRNILIGFGLLAVTLVVLKWKKII